MKKILITVLPLLVFLSCDNEPIDAGLLNLEDPDTENPNTDEFAMTTYRFDTTTTVPIFGEIIVNADFDISNNNVVTSVDTESQFFGESLFSNSILFRNGSGQITSVNTLENNIAQNELSLAYVGPNISMINYDDLQDDSEDYSYTFSYSGNEVTRTSSNSTVSVTYLFNNNNRLIEKRATQGGSVLLEETLTYDGNGNCIQSTLTGETSGQYTYSYDSFTNPLKAVFNDQYLFSLFNADYDDEAAPVVAQFHSANNWISISSGGITTNFEITTDSQNRILTRSGNYNLGDGVSVSQDETFTYAN
ncbi:MAG: hypothetical protein KJO22_08555 [Bacteroidia bacterium]|nr:hypothetical protein [Bacteroidia bacterium]NNF85925.1 hypothetical protein [Winogradskyella sp.]